MAEEPKRVELKCSNCDRVLGTLPAGEQLDVTLVCPKCGAAVYPPGPVTRLIGEVTRVINRITGKDPGDAAG